MKRVNNNKVHLKPSKPRRKAHWSDFLKKIGACSDSVRFCRRFKSLLNAWNALSKRGKTEMYLYEWGNPSIEVYPFHWKKWLLSRLPYAATTPFRDPYGDFHYETFLTEVKKLDFWTPATREYLNRFYGPNRNRGH